MLYVKVTKRANPKSSHHKIKKFFFSFFCSFGLHLRHMEVPRLGGQINCWPPPQPQQLGIQATSRSVTYTTAHGNTGSLIH